MEEIKRKMIEILSTRPLFDIELTSHCNINCVFCPRDQMNKNNRLGIMTPETIEYLIEWLPRKGDVMLSGLGEPLLNNRIYNSVKNLKRHGLGVTIITNGTLLTKDAAEKLIEAGVDEIQVSFHHINPEKFSKIEKGANFFKVYENIRTLSDLAKNNKNVRLRLNIVVFEKNNDVIDDIRKFAEELGFNLYIRNIHSRGGSIQEKQRKGMFQHLYTGCGIFPKVHFIKYDGTILPCVNDVLGKYPIGSISDISFSELLNIKRKLIENTVGELFPMCRVCTDEYRKVILDRGGDI